MASTSSDTASTVSRYRPAILALTLLGAAASIYYIHSSYFSPGERPIQHPLRRRNAIHRLNGRRRGGENERFAHEVLLNASNSARVRNSRRYLEACGSCMVETSSGGRFPTFLTPAVLQNTDEFRRAHGLSEAEASQARYDLEEAFLDAYLNEYDNPPSLELLNGGGRDWDELLALGFLPASLTAAITRYNARFLDRPLNRTDSERGEQSEGHQETNDDGVRERTVNGLDGRETVVDVNSEFSWRGEDDNEPPKEGQSLLNLLYHIAEDQARREGYIHRGVTCNSCGSMPIRGIRYRCANCVDYDNCETCEAMQVHPKTHLFYKVRIPAPFLGNPRQAQPVWYPGKPNNLPQNLSRDFARKLVKDSGFENPEIEALWDQFRCLAATEWVEDPNKLNMAIDRRTFDRCFIPNTSIRPPPPNLIYDRMFAFYDTNGDGLIGFEEFLKGLASLNHKSKDERLKRVFQGYDIDGDGYVDRKDFLRMFRAFYALSKELTRDMVAGMEDNLTEDNAAREIVLSSQPISSAFTDSIPPGERSRIGEGKRRDVHGDDEIIDNQPPLRESGDDTGSMNEVVADAAEKAAFGNVSSDSERQPWDSMFTDGEALEQVENDNAHTFLRDRNRTRSDDWESTDANGDEEPIGGSSNHLWAADNDGWSPSYVRISDFQDALGSYNPDNELTEQDREKIRTTARQRMEREGKEDRKKRDEIRQEAVQERWRRREFYLDEEDGGATPEGFNDVNGVGEDNLQVGSDDRSGASQPHSPALRSRSSSKVRFQDDIADLDNETRSNASASSRNIPIGERWGGYEIPEAEKDVGKEVLYQVTQQGLNEMLDPLFKAKEDLAMEALATRAERDKWRKELSQFVDRTKGKDKKNGTQRTALPTTQNGADPASPRPGSPDGSQGASGGRGVTDSTRLIPGYVFNASIRDGASQYLKRVQHQFKDQPNVYMHFLETLKAFQTKILGTTEVITRISILLADFPELIDGFNVYLPPGYRIDPGRGYPLTETRLHIGTNGGTLTLDIPKDEEGLCSFVGLPFTENSSIPPSTRPAHTLEVVEELHKAVNAFNENDEALKATILAKPLDELLEDSGYSITTPLPESTASLTNHTSNETFSHDPAVDQRRADTPTSEVVNGANPHQEADLTQPDDNTDDRLPVIGQTVLYSAEFLANLAPQHRITLSKRLHNRYRQLHLRLASATPLGSTDSNEANSTHPAADTAATTMAFSSTGTVLNRLEIKKELRRIEKQIIRLIDLNIAGDRWDMLRAKNTTPSQSSPPPEQNYNSNNTNNADERPDPTLPQHRPTTTTSTTINTPPPSSSSSATRGTTHSRSLPFPPPLPPPSTLPPMFPQRTAIPTATPPAISPPPRSRLQHLALLDEVEREDTERGGKGRLSFDEFEEIMKGERGKKLGFVGAWIEMASF